VSRQKQNGPSTTVANAIRNRESLGNNLDQLFQEGDQRIEPRRAVEDYALVRICGLRASNRLTARNARHRANAQTSRLRGKALHGVKSS